MDTRGQFAIVDDAIYILIGLIVTICVICAAMSNSEFRDSWNSFCNAVGNGLSSIWYTIKNNVFDTFRWSKSKVKKATKASKQYIEAQRILKKIPKALKTKDGKKVDIGKFKGKGPKLPKGGRGKLGPKKWYIGNDTDGHGGSKWKLFNRAGERIASLSKDGTVLRK